MLRVRVVEDKKNPKFTWKTLNLGDDGDDGSYFGKIPVLDTGKGTPGNEYCIFSSNAIARYLALVRPDVGL